jgi:hypothetical protein
MLYLLELNPILLTHPTLSFSPSLPLSLSPSLPLSLSLSPSSSLPLVIALWLSLGVGNFSQRAAHIFL